LLFFFSAGSPDILICGNCREMFSDLVDMMEHKRDYCKLRFTCKCDALNEDGECTDANCSPHNNIATTNATGSTIHGKMAFLDTILTTFDEWLFSREHRVLRRL
jgi:hypothetical protein